MNDREEYTCRKDLPEVSVVTSSVSHGSLTGMQSIFSEGIHSSPFQLCGDRLLPHLGGGDGPGQLAGHESIREDNGCTSFRFCCPLPCDPPSTLSQYPDYLLPQSSPFHFLNPMPGAPLSSTSGSWTPEGTVHYGIMSGEICDAVASISSDSAEDHPKEGFLKQEPTAEQRHHTQMDLCQPANHPLAVFLPPLDQQGGKLAVQTPNVCQVLCNMNGGGQMVVVNHCSPGQVIHSRPPGHISPEPPYYTSQGNSPEHCPRCGKDVCHPMSSCQMGSMVPSSVAEACPVPSQSYLSCLNFPQIRSAHTFLPSSSFIPPAPLGPGVSYNFMPGPYISQFHQTQSPLCPDSLGLVPDGQPKVSLVRFNGSCWDSKSKRPCNCTKSQCLKLYCDCFANGEVCSNCNCINCCNNTAHESERYKAIKICLDRNPEAFRPKIGNGKLGEVKGRHNKGCNCKRSGCLKNYCECYEAKIMCSSTCKCVGCRNYEESPERKPSVWDGPDADFHNQTSGHKNKCPLACITLDVVEATCGCLLAQAEEAEKEGYTLSQAERMILEEFGQCLTQIVRSIFKSSSLQV